jgi:RNA polymerase sigma-70 factor, ECF subfamily
MHCYRWRVCGWNTWRVSDRYEWTVSSEYAPEDIPAIEPEFFAIDGLANCLPRVLSELSEEDREAIQRCDLEGMPQALFAELKGLSLPGAKSRIQRARQRLRAQMSQACQVRLDEAGHVCCFVPRPPLG